MLYVFLVDTGAMQTFEMELAMESVETLMKSIESTLLIPVEKQVLITPEGEALDPSHRICNYSSAGTESNPIFLFSKIKIESPVPPSPSLNMGSETALQEEVEKSLNLHPTYETLVSRSQLASTFEEMSMAMLDSSVSLIHEQMLQRNGWFAVVANLENIAKTFETRALILEENFAEFKELTPSYRSLLDSFPTIIDQLSRLPVFECLINDEIKSSSSNNGKFSLLDWINAQDERNSLNDTVKQCEDALAQFENSSLLEIQKDRVQVLGDVSNTNMKEIGGLEERLAMLEKLKEKACAFSEEQADMAKGFFQNQMRAQNIGDPSVLPDLCSSHQAQLSLMMHNHTQLRDIRRRCAKAKDELSVNLHTRLRWVMMIEKKICDCDNKLVFYHESMKRMKKRMEILEQISFAPRTYALTVKEVIRRREFTSHFTKWAKDVYQQSDSVCQEEIAHRHKYFDCVGNHFVLILFNGIEELPKQYITVPENLDIELPSLSFSHLDELLKLVPELFENCLDYLTREKLHADKERKSSSCCNLSTVKEIEIKSSDTIDGKVIDEDTMRTKEVEIKSSSDTIDGKVINEDTMRTEEVEIKSSSDTIDGKVINEDTMRTEEVEIKSSSDTIDGKVIDKDKIRTGIESTSEQENERFVENSGAGNVEKSKDCENCCFENRELLKELSENVDNLKKKTSGLNYENESLRKEIEAKDRNFSEKELMYQRDLERQKLYASELEAAKESFESEQQIRFNSAIGRVLKEKEVALKKADEQLLNFKFLQEKSDEKLQVIFNEKEALRQESDEVSKKLINTERMVSQLELELEKSKVEALEHIKEKEREYTKQLENQRDEAARVLESEKLKWEAESGSGSGQIISELVVDRFKKRIKYLEEENDLLKKRMKSTVDGDMKLSFVELQQKLNDKCKECDSLRAELELLKQTPQNSQVVSKDLQKGDIVEVYYNEQYDHYMIKAHGETLHFVHPDSLISIELPESKSGHSLKAQILEKEYCQAKKANNRFKVNTGTKFYRVKVRVC
ncbi:RB1-inducible coiled-coil protein 1-like [Xenia sp. Carnegie-2017]|uniref:RB1-inducible coiled-coil protein 1-like n=1 Tax=Xenia sp. Carnegie-2017 TaxID=2897299 RepID=UPI001F03C690|nr:RB1-inducible coiled-coil protein 1-like [Xenia sp. Carnegie-2017]